MDIVEARSVVKTYDSGDVRVEALRGVDAENVELPLLVSRVGGTEARRRAFETLELVGIPGRARHLPEQLSGGERGSRSRAPSTLAPAVRAAHVHPAEALRYE